MPRKIDTAVIEYIPDFSAILKSDRQLTSAFRQVEATAERSAERVESSFEEIGRSVDDVFNEIAREANVAFSDISREADQSADTVGRQFQAGGERAEDAFNELQREADRSMAGIAATSAVANRSMSAGFSKMGLIGGAALLGIGAAATAGLGALAAMGLASAAQIEQLQIGFNALLGSVEEGTRVFKQLQQFAATTPFEFPEIASAAKRFLAFNDAIGMSDDQLIGFLTTIGDITSVMGTGAEGMNRIALALGQIASRGKLSLEELNQISEAVPGFSALSAIASAFGITTAEAMDRISAGSINATDGIAAILQGMREFPGAAGAMEMQSKTLLGVFSTFKDVMGQTLAESFAPAIPAIKDALTEATPILKEALGELAPAIGGLLSAILPLLAQLAKAITPIITPIVDALGPALEALGPSLVPLGEVLGELLVALAPTLPLLANFLAALLEIAVPILQILVPAFKLLTPVIQFMSDAIAEFVKWLRSIDWAGVGNAIGGFFSDLWESIVVDVKNRFDAIITFFKMLPDLFVGALTALPGILLSLFKAAFAGPRKIVENTVDAIIGFWVKLPKRLSNFASNIGQSIVNFIKRFLNNAIDAVNSGIAQIDAIVPWGLPRIPRLAHGGIAMGPAVIGEDPSTAPEAAIPLGDSRALSMLRDALGTGGPTVNFAPGSVVVNVNGAMNEDQAKKVGTAVGENIAGVLANRGIRTAVRVS